MPKGTVRDSKMTDIISLQEQGLRAADMRELDALGVEPFDALFDGLQLSKPHCRTILVDRIPAAMFGVAPVQGTPMAGLIWLLGSNLVTTIPAQFLRESKDWLTTVSQHYDIVGNVVHQDNKVHIRWLKWLGFKFLKQHGQFIEFVRMKQPCVDSQPLG